VRDLAKKKEQNCRRPSLSCYIRHPEMFSMIQKVTKLHTH